PPEEVVDFSRVFVDGVNVPGAQILIDEDYFPSHVELMPVLQALGLNHTWDEMTHEVTIGDDISFTAGVDYETVLDVGVLFVPLGFVREVLQIPGVSVESGEVQIRTHVVEDDMF
ncbi:MAG: copper amine oxidase N-terminal domain-containing protein, partial [Oscillospiraceae bacterium]|nr:copper amine oxidase N-terminal domain-containing protein [Oscillospiraceae bacterium]